MPPLPSESVETASKAPIQGPPHAAYRQDDYRKWPFRGGGCQVAHRRAASPAGPGRLPSPSLKGRFALKATYSVSASRSPPPQPHLLDALITALAQGTLAPHGGGSGPVCYLTPSVG